MEIKRVDTLDEAKKCDELLSKLILFEKAYDDNINENFKVDNWYPKFYEDEKRGLYIAIDNGNIVGYIYGYTYDDPSYINKMGFIDALFIEEAYRGKGYGKALINQFISLCKEKGVKQIQIKAIIKNTAALNLYKNAGFKEQSVKLGLNL